MIKRSLTIVLFVSICAYKTNTHNEYLSGSKPNDSTEYVKEAMAFIYQVKGSELKNERFILESSSVPDDMNECLEYLWSDTNTLSVREREFIKSQIKEPVIRIWTNVQFPKIQIINSDTIKRIFEKGLMKGWDNFEAHYGLFSSFNGFSLPIFLKNYTWCLFYSDHHCGDLCGSGELILYKKEGEKWIEVKSYCRWIS